MKNRHNLYIQLTGKMEKNIPNNSIFVSPIYTSSLAGNIFVYTPSHITNRKKHSNLINYKNRMPTLAVNKHLSIHFLSQKPRIPLCRRKSTSLICQKWTSKCVFPRRHHKENYKQKIECFP